MNLDTGCSKNKLQETKTRHPVCDSNDLEGHRTTFTVHTVWKCHDFCVIQILREINFEDF